MHTLNEPAHDNTYNTTRVTSKEKISLHFYAILLGFSFNPFLDNLESAEITCDLRRIRYNCADALADLSRLWLRKIYCLICRALAKIMFYI